MGITSQSQTNQQIKIKRALHPLARLAGILSNLVFHLKKGYAGEYAFDTPSRIVSLETAFHFLGVLARRCRESLTFLRMGVNLF